MYFRRAMRPLDDATPLSAGQVLYHSAFGFARIRSLEDDGVHLDWAREGERLPRVVRLSSLRKVYALCPSGGFFDRAVTERDDVVQEMDTKPVYLLQSMLQDLRDPQQPQDILDWLVSLDLLPETSFQRWWDGVQSLVRLDGRFIWNGAMIKMRPDVHREQVLQAVPLEAQLQDLFTEDIQANTSDFVTFETDEEPTLITADLMSLAGESSLDQATITPVMLPRVGLNLARALRAHHDAGRSVAPSADRIMVDTDCAISIECDPAADTTPQEDVYVAARILLEVLLGRSWDQHAEPITVMPFLRHITPTLPPSSMAPLQCALNPNSEKWIDSETWEERWKASIQAESTRDAYYDPEFDLKAGYDTHIGRVKALYTQTNQDALFLKQTGHVGLFVVADGISIADVGSGDVAAGIATRVITNLWEKALSDIATGQAAVIQRLLDKMLRVANQAVCEASIQFAGGPLDDRIAMGTTVLAGISIGNRVFLAALGDSRIYLLGRYGASLLTADHSQSGELLEHWAEGHVESWHPRGLALTRYLGHFDDTGQPAAAAAQHLDLVLRPDERLVICSDGLSDFAGPTHADVSDNISGNGWAARPDRAARDLVRIANEGGGGDNTTVIVLGA